MGAVKELMAEAIIEKTEKVRLSLMPIEGIQAGAKAFEDGAAKYGRGSFRTMKDALWSDCIDSLLRHAHAFSDGENIAADSGVTHLGHIIARASMLQYWLEHDIGTDDRNS